MLSFSVALRPNAGHGLLILEVSRSHTTQHSRQDSSGRVISSSQRPLPNNTQHSQQTNIHAPGGIRTHELSRQAAANLRLRPRGHWDRRFIYVPRLKCIYYDTAHMYCKRNFSNLCSHVHEMYTVQYSYLCQTDIYLKI